MGGLQQHDFGGEARCVVCGVQAVGPCARCHDPLCGDCCVIAEGGVKTWAVCPGCAEAGASLRSGWWGVIGWILLPMGVLALLLVALQLLASAC